MEFNKIIEAGEELPSQNLMDTLAEYEELADTLVAPVSTNPKPKYQTTEWYQMLESDKSTKIHQYLRTYLQKYNSGIQFPISLLKSYILAEKNLSAQKYPLVNLPARRSVYELFRYCMEEMEERSTEMEDAKNAILFLFDNEMSTFCLSPIEKFQLQHMRGEVLPSNVYGVIHLIRFALEVPKIVDNKHQRNVLYKVTVPKFMNELLKYLNQDKMYNGNKALDCSPSLWPLYTFQRATWYKLATTPLTTEELNSNIYVTTLQHFGIDIPDVLLDRYYSRETTYMDKQYDNINLPAEVNIYHVFCQLMESCPELPYDIKSIVLYTFEQIVYKVLLTIEEKFEFEKINASIESPGNIFGTLHFMRFVFEMPGLLTKIFVTPYFNEAIPKFINRALILINENADTMSPR